MQLKVTKADGTVEDYLHTKIIGTISYALTAAGEADIDITEGLADAVTYFLYRDGRHIVTSGEIFSIVNACLCATGYEQAGSMLTEQHCHRKLQRERIEVISGEPGRPGDVRGLLGPEGRSRWEKSVIVDHLVSKYKLSRETARAIAGMVEQKVFAIGLMAVPMSLIRQLVFIDSENILRAQRQLQATD